jgi:alpha-mannosidase
MRPVPAPVRAPVRTLVLALALAAAAPARAQEAAPTLDIPAGWLRGYTRTISATQVIAYPWAYPGQVSTLLVRAVDGTWRVEWEGQAAPAGPPDERVVYLWHGGLASGYGAHRFTLTVNGTPCATFTSGRDVADRTWRREGDNGCTLAFQTIRVGTFNELFGLMMLTVPRRIVGAAAPRFAVVGEAAGSQDYYLGPETPVEAYMRVRPEQARFKDGRRAVRIEVSHLASAAPFLVRTGATELHRGILTPGYNLATFAVDGKAASLPITVEVSGRVASEEETALPPVRAWEIHLLAHSHVDIGYSDPQPEVERKQWKNLRDAVALAAATASNPPDSRFRWNVEGLWSVESYLKQASADERRQFIEAVREGSIGLQANYTNILTGLCTPEELGRWTDAARQLSAEYGLPIARSAMHTDIPGLSWTVVSALARGGVRYFSSGPNYMPSLADGGDRIGGTLHELGDRPFWWLSPSGQDRLLMWVAGRGYSLFHGMNSGPIETTGQRTLLDYLLELAGKDYPYDMVQVRYTIGGDNGPTDPKLPGFVKSWNETFETPRLVIDTADALFGAFERKYGAKLPERRGDMTPYWEDGAVSSAAEEAMVRTAARRLQQAETLWAMRNRVGFPAQAFSDAWRQVLLWHEHTWGAADSISQPDRKDVVDQWQYKRAFALESDRLSRALLDAGAPPPGPAFEVTNTLSWGRTGVVFLPAAATKGRDKIVDAAGRVVPSQRLADGRLAAGVAVSASSAIRIRPVGGAATAMPFPTIRGVPPVVATRTTLDNGNLRVELDSKTGDIRSLTSYRMSGRQFVREGAGLNRYLYVPGRDPSAAVGPGPVTVRVVDNGPVVATLEISSPAPGAARLIRRVSLAMGADGVDIETTIDKTLVREKESAHIAFALNVPGGGVRADLGEAVVTFEQDQLPGSCKDFVGVTSAIDVSNAQAGVTIVSLDAPLFEIGALTDERSVNGRPRAWRKQVTPGSDVFAYLLNNYWHTNYKADQEGRMTFRFHVRPHGPFDPAELRRAGAASEQPLLVMPSTLEAPLPALPFILEGSAVVVSAVRPADDGRAIVVRLYNPAAAPASTRLLGVTLPATATAPGQAVHGPIRLPPFGTIVLRVESVATR